jgi:TRAP-type mannitol/chloroaromatic compound transport system substrate-binding protein
MFIRKKIEESVREIQQLENNLSFISNASADNPLVKNVRKNINQFKEGLELWEQKLHYLRTLDY